jgi:hypothetical protein
MANFIAYFYILVYSGSLPPVKKIFKRTYLKLSNRSAKVPLLLSVGYVKPHLFIILNTTPFVLS